MNVRTRCIHSYGPILTDICRDRRLFVYLKGLVLETRGLKSSILTLSAQQDGGGRYVRTGNLADFLKLAIRKNEAHGRELRHGRNELVLDLVVLGDHVETGNYTITAEATLPSGKILFCLETIIHLESRKMRQRGS